MVAAAVEETNAARIAVGVEVGEGMVAASAGVWLIGFERMEDAAQGEAGSFVEAGLWECFSRSGEPPLLSAGRHNEICMSSNLFSGGSSVGAGVRGMEDMDHNIVCRKEGVVLCLGWF